MVCIVSVVWVRPCNTAKCVPISIGMNKAFNFDVIWKMIETKVGLITIISINFTGNWVFRPELTRFFPVFAARRCSLDSLSSTKMENMSKAIT